MARASERLVICLDNSATKSRSNGPQVWDSFKFALYSLVLGVMTYSLLQLFAFGRDILICYWHIAKSHRSGPISWIYLQIWSIAQNGSATIFSWEIVAAVLLAVPVAFIVAACLQHKLITRIGNFLHVSPKYGDENLYSYFMNAKEVDWVYVRDKENDLTYQGRVSVFAENDQLHELVLLDVSVYRYEDTALLYSVPRAYLCKEIGKLVIETVPDDRLPKE
jgi:hypothetical protein